MRKRSYEQQTRADDRISHGVEFSKSAVPVESPAILTLLISDAKLNV
jgi:hypothetical protein